MPGCPRHVPDIPADHEDCTVLLLVQPTRP